MRERVRHTPKVYEPGDPGPIGTQLQTKEPPRWMERVLLLLLLPCAGIAIAALLSTTPAPPSRAQPFGLREDEVQQKYPGGTFISPSVYKVCLQGKYWLLYGNGASEPAGEACWR
jgi:hypothetical protein